MATRMNYGKRFRGNSVASVKPQHIPGLNASYAKYFGLEFGPEARKRGVLKRASVMSKAKIHLAGDPPDEPPPPPPVKIKTYCKMVAHDLLLQSEAMAPGYIRCSTRDRNQTLIDLLTQGFLNVDPQNPENNTFAITKKGMDYCAWLRSKK